MRPKPKIPYVPLLVITCVAALVGLFARFPDAFPDGAVLVQRLTGKYTTADRLETYGEVAGQRWQPFFEKADITYPPQKLALVAFKAEKQLEIYAQQDGKWKFVRRVPVLRDSGHMGPKLREGDGQVPEGFYRIESLNPNSLYHLALRISYPNEQDREIAAQEGRSNLGGDIMIHGGQASVGCLAMGDEVAEDLFVLAAQTGLENIEMVICPLDFRDGKVPADSERPKWVSERYAQLDKFVHTLPREST